MGQQRKCSFHRALNVVSYGFGIGLCDLEGEDTVCEGDIRYCEKADALVSHLFQEGSIENTRRATRQLRGTVNALNS
jgi:hypothetical protein